MCRIIVRLMFSILLFSTVFSSASERGYKATTVNTTMSDGKIYCNVIDFDTTTAPPDFKHWYPLKSLYSEYEYEYGFPKYIKIGEVSSESELFEYWQKLLDTRRQKVLYSGNDYNAVKQQCINYIKKHSDFTIKEGECHYSDEYSEKFGKVINLDGEFVSRKINDLRNFPGVVQISNAQFQEVFYQTTRCSIPEVDIDKSYIMALPFVMLYPDEDDCDEECQDINGTNKKSGKIKKKFSPTHDILSQSSGNVGVLSAFESYSPLDYIYSTDRNGINISGYWSNASDVRLVTGRVNPYLKSSESKIIPADQYEVHQDNIQIWRDGKISSEFILKIDNGVETWISINGDEKLYVDSLSEYKSSCYTLENNKLDKEHFCKGKLDRVKFKNGTVLDIAEENDVKQYRISKGSEDVIVLKEIKEITNDGSLISFITGNFIYNFYFDKEEKLYRYYVSSDTGESSQPINFKYENKDNETLLTKVYKNNKTYISYEYDDEGEAINTKNRNGEELEIDYLSTTQRRTVNERGLINNYDFDDDQTTISCENCNSNIIITKNSYEDGSLITEFDGSQINEYTDFEGKPSEDIFIGKDNTEESIQYFWDYKKPLLSGVTYKGSYGEMSYDEHGWVKEIKKDGTIISSFDYDDYGNTTSVGYQSNDNILKYFKIIRNSKGLIENISNELNEKIIEINQYDNLGRASSYSILGRANYSASYNLDNNMSSFNDGVNSYNYLYDSDGNLSQVNINEDKFMAYSYNDAGYLISQSNAKNQKINFERDEFGNEISREYISSSGEVKYTEASKYDKQNRLTYKNTFGIEQYFEYDGYGNLIEAKNGNNAYKYIYNSKRELIEKINPLGNTTQFKREDNNEYVTVITPEGIENEVNYDKNGNIKSTYIPAAGERIYTYNSFGNLYQYVDSYGNNFKVNYNSNNNPIEFNYNNGDYVLKLEYTNLGGRLKKAIEGSGKTEFEYDSFGREIARTWSNNEQELTLKHLYNDEGYIETLVYPSGSEISYEYDANGNILNILLNKHSNREYVLKDIEHMPFGTFYEFEFGNGVVLKKSFNTSNQISEIFYGKQKYYNYDYDESGNISKISDLNGYEYSFEYDYLGQMTYDGASGFKYSYDKDSNIVNKKSESENFKYLYNEKKQLVAVTSEVDKKTLSYNSNGNITNYMNQSIIYNSRDRISKVQNINGITSYFYNYENQRVIKEVNGKRIYYFYDSNGDLISEYDGKAYKEYIYLAHIPVAVITDSKLYFIYSDNIGTPVKVSDKNKKVVWEASYDAFGETHLGRKDISLNIRRLGQYYDYETGFYYNWHRYYIPELGRFNKPDELGFVDTHNIYGYANHNPISITDRLGQTIDKPWLEGTFAHGLFFDYVNKTYPTYTTNLVNYPVFGNKRPDIQDSELRKIWEVKPYSCNVNPGRRNANKQLNDYLKLANREGDILGNRWRIGDSTELIPAGSYIRASGTYYNGAYYTVDFFPDVNSSSGLIFYEVVDRKNTFERVDQIVSELFKGVDRNSLSNGLPGYVPFRLPIIP